MKLKIFGELTDIFGSDEYHIQNTSTIRELREKLESIFNKLKDFNYIVAVNKKVVDENYLIPNEAEIALLPPFAGG